MIDYIRDNARVSGILEKFKDSSKGKRGTESSNDFDFVKFVLRLSVKSDQHLSIHSSEIYESIPVEVQLFTIPNHWKREHISEVSHFEYKRRQFMKLFPVIFPQKIYAPVLRDDAVLKRLASERTNYSGI